MSKILDNIRYIITSIDKPLSNINPTQIYNEGWMTRLLVYNSIVEKLVYNEIDFSKMKNWCSEALISSPFLPRTKSDPLAEGYTHADIALGDFEVDFSYRGEINLIEPFKVFGIIEAKMGSNLSQGTKNIENYNQAARNIICIAFNTYKLECKIFFGVVAPEKIINKHDISYQLKKENILSQVIERFNMYDDDFKASVKMDLIISKINECRIFISSYEEWINHFDNQDIKKALNEFYDKSIKWNKIDF